jgi:hypothetical protein
MKGHFFLGLALLELELFDEAVKHLQRGTERYRLAYCYSVLEEFYGLNL